MPQIAVTNPKMSIASKCVPISTLEIGDAFVFSRDDISDVYIIARVDLQWLTYYIGIFTGARTNTEVVADCEEVYRVDIKGVKIRFDLEKRHSCLG